MKSWLRFFGLSFFSNKIAKEATRRGVFNFFLGFLFALVFIFCGVLAANTLPFSTHYKKASAFKSFVREAFDNCNVWIEGGKGNAGAVVNTFPEDVTAAGYKLVIDTRPSDSFDDFEAYCTLKSGGGEISYESYLDLPESEKGRYDFKLRYTDKILVLDEGITAKHEEFLSTREGDIANRYSALAEKKGGLSAEQYKESVYALYIEAYYPDLSAYERTKIPRIRTYYYLNYLNKSELKEYLFVFDDSLIGNFKTDSGLEVGFYGVYDKVSDRTVNGDAADKFIKDAFGSALPLMSNVYAMNIIKYLPFLVVAPLLLALVSWIVMRFLKADIKCRTFVASVKIQGSFLAFGALISAFAVFICGFFASASVLNLLPLVLFFAALLIRTAVFLICEKLNKNKLNDTAEEDENDSTFGTAQ